MSFWAYFAIIALLSIMGGALYMAKKASLKEEEILRKKHRIRDIRNEIVDLDELLHTLMVYDKNPELLDTLLEQMFRDIEEGLTLLPDSPDLLQDLAALEPLKAQINEIRELTPSPETPNSDRQIFLMKKHFSLTLKFIRTLHSKGELDDLSARTHRERLMRNAVLHEVHAYVNQGNAAKAEHELSMAANLFKHAKEVLVKTEVDIPSKNEEIKRISKMISGLFQTLPEDKEHF